MEEFWIDQTAKGVVLKNGKPVGIVIAEANEYAILGDALQQHGYHTQPAESAADGAIEYDQQCTIEDPRPCEVNVTLNQVDDLAREAGLTETPIDQLIARGKFSEDQAAQAIQSTIAAMPPGELRENAELWYQAAFGDEGLSHGESE
ncbi:MAG: hypothetical protein OWQ57_13305 [Sulfobacillus sp.]|nr:hypothetical protein [Sulfobacillus sp.]